MNVIISKKDRTQVSHKIDFQEKEWIDFSFDEKELALGSMRGMMENLTFFSAIPFYKYLQTVKAEKREPLKNIFINWLDAFLNEALESEDSIENTIQAAKKKEFYLFTENLYVSWLKQNNLNTNELLEVLRDYRFIELRASFGDFYTLDAIFKNKEGNKRQFPLSRVYYYESASDYLIRRTATLSLYIAEVLLKKLGCSPTPLQKEMSSIEEFEEKQLRIVKDYLKTEKCMFGSDSSLSYG